MVKTILKGIGVLALVFAYGCSQRTTIVLTHDAGVDIEAEIERLIDLCGAEIRSTSTREAQTKVVLTTIVGEQSGELITRMLDRAVEETGATGPIGMKIVIEEDDSAALAALGLTQGQELSYVLDVNKAQRNLRGQKTQYGATRFCSYDVPVNGELPSLTYTQSFASSGESEALNKLREMLGSIPLTADHRMEFSNPSLDSLAPRVGILSRNEISFIFDTTEEHSSFMQGSAFTGDFMDCSETILDKCPAGFFGTIMFPMLSNALVSYEIKTAFTF